MMSQAFKQFFLFALLAGFAFNLMLLLHAQDDQTGFISIDCGLADTSSYSETTTKIKYVSDANFIDTGENNMILYQYRSFYQQPYGSLRSFLDGTRNCYKINVTSGTKYLIRASFLYGNYDGQDKLPKFELHLGPNLWDSVEFWNASISVNKELIHVPLRSYIHVCLMKTGSDVPFISAIELRPLANKSYQTQSKKSLALVSRYDMGLLENQNGYRYPFDIYDRFWYYYFYKQDKWTQLNTSSTIDSDDHNSYQPPPVVMSTVVTPKNPTDNSLVIIFWPPEGADRNTEYYSFMHFAEIIKLQPNQSRQFYSTIDGELFYGLFSPSYLYTTTIYSNEPWRSTGQYVNISIIGADNSTLPPILNAYEIYMAKNFSESETNQEDVDAIQNIKLTYKIGKNWQGDPCAPQDYSWEGLKCSYNENEAPRIISLDLSSSGLTGFISPSISNLSMIHTLDLSNNNLTGPIPDFLSGLPNLNVLNLEKNKLTGSVPVGLIERRKNGSLSLSFCDNPNLSRHVSCKLKKKHNFLVPVVVSIIGIFILLLTVSAISWWRIQRKRQPGEVTDSKPTIQLRIVESSKRKFTYSEILEITNNFERVLGKGGFGTVFHGYIGRTQAAIKMLSPSSVQGLQQFNAEVDLLMRVHHKNLTSLVGYCIDEANLGLVYEYMANGNLQEHLSDGGSNILTWEDRLRIATEAAQGLEYLHHGCKPPIIHRDVKSTNILLNENFQAKLSDFGLSRIFPTDEGTHITTGVAGTPGYLAPEYGYSNRLNEKSDVYSFGIVLLEIITSRPAISRTRERIHISDWVGSKLEKGDIYSIFDLMLKRSFSVNSAWKAVEIAMKCVSTNPIERPIMTEVVVGLKECLATELARTKSSRNETELGNSIEVMYKNSIAMLSPSAR